MESKSCATALIPVQGIAGDAATLGGDWKAQLDSGSRQRIINKITDTLKRHCPFSGEEEELQKLNNIAVKFEEKIYAEATSQTDYLRKISLKMLSMENKSQNPVGNPMPANATCNSTNSSDQGTGAVPSPCSGERYGGSEAASERSEGDSRGQKKRCTDASAAASEKAKGKHADVPDTEVPSDVIDELTLGNRSFTDEDAMTDIGRIWPSVERHILAQSLGGKRLVGHAYLHNAAGSVYMDAALKQYNELEARLAKLEAELVMHSTAQNSAEKSRDAIKNDYLDLKKRYEAEVTKVKEEINAVRLELEQEKAAKLEMAEKLKKKDDSLVLERATSTKLGKELESAKLELIELRASLQAADMV